MRRVLSRAAVCSAVLAFVLFAGVSSAHAAPRILSVNASNPIAYDLKSFLTTRFSARVDSSNVYAVLKVQTSSGDVVVYKGAIPNANQTFYFPNWNGKRSDGKRLPPATYTYVLTVSKGGTSSSASGKILISNVYFGHSGKTTPGVVDRWSGYLKGRNTNVYIQATTTNASSEGIWLGFGIEQPGFPWVDDWGFAVYQWEPVNTVEHIPYTLTGIYNFSMSGPDYSASYKITVIQ